MKENLFHIFLEIKYECFPQVLFKQGEQTGNLRGRIGNFNTENLSLDDTNLISIRLITFKKNMFFQQVSGKSKISQLEMQTNFI